MWTCGVCARTACRAVHVDVYDVLPSDSKIRSSTQQKFQSLVFLGGTIGAAARAQRVPPHRCGGVRGRSAPPRNFGPLDIKNCYFYTWFLHLNSAQ